MTKFSDSKAIIDHYDTEIGLGNLYKLNTDWLTGIKTILLGWEKVPEHPGGVHYAYDFTGKNANESLRKPFLESFSNLKIKKGNVLDCGCGVGGASYVLATLNKNVKFFGVSLSSGQINAAIKRAARAGIKNVEYQVGDYLSLSFPSGFFDGVIGIETFCHVEERNKSKLFKELKRVLKRGCNLAIFDAYLANKSQKQMQMPKQHAKVFRGWSLPDKISTVEFFLSSAKVEGFEVIKAKNIVERILPWSKEVRDRVLFARPIVPLVSKIIELRRTGIKIPLVSHFGLDNPNVLKFAYTAEFQYDMFAKGDVEYWEIVLKRK